MFKPLEFDCNWGEPQPCFAPSDEWFMHFMCTIYGTCRINIPNSADLEHFADMKANLDLYLVGTSLNPDPAEPIYAPPLQTV